MYDTVTKKWQSVVVLISFVDKSVLTLQCMDDECNVCENGPWIMMKGQNGGKDGWQRLSPKKEDPKIKVSVPSLLVRGDHGDPPSAQILITW